MNSLVLRGICLFAVSLLAACQSAPQSTEPAREDLSHALQQFEHTLEKGDLDSAEKQLRALQEGANNKAELEQYQRLLADAYLQLGQQALQKGDVNTATSALSRARSLLPKAPALTSGINQAIAQANSIVIDLPELSDDDRLGKTLDGVASEVVKSQRMVRIEVRQSGDAAILTAQLDSRIKQLEPNFKVLYSVEVDPQQNIPRLILLPRH
ncbi:hypothetical protein WG219_01090 [Ectopseudomonas mendocina]|uniref:Lipoprotein n=1 Tax=Ectopseudomonas mendocina TaxID=300 RepID=A0ABZ2RIJ7_ECTME